MLHLPSLERPRAKALLLHEEGASPEPFTRALVARGFSVLEQSLSEPLPKDQPFGLLVGLGRAANPLVSPSALWANASALVLIASEVEETNARSLRSWKKPLLILHSVHDGHVAIERAETLFAAASQPKSFITLESGDHHFSERSDAERAADQIGDWAAPRWATEARAPHEKDHHGDVTVSWLGQGMAHVVHAPPHHVLADEPPDLGGDERGPNPYDLLLGALGACTAMTVRMYANLKKWPLEGMSVRLRHARIYAKDCGDCETKDGMVDRIDREIKLEGPLSEEQQNRLLEIANKCPVHKTLTTETRIPTVQLR